MANPSEHERFTEGDCHILAHAIAAQTGWKFCTFQWRDDGPSAHAFVQMPDGRYLDVEGVKTHDEMMAAWGAKPPETIRVWGEGEIENKHPEWGVNGSWWPSSPKVAARVARKILWHSNEGGTA